MSTPNMYEVERLVTEFRADAMGYAQCRTAGARTALDTAKAALLDYVRGIVIALKIKTEEHDCCAEDLIALRSEAAQRPAGGVAIAQVIESGDYEAKVQWLLNPLPVGSVLYEEAPQPVSAAEVPMPEPYTYMGCGWDARPVYSAKKLEAYGDAREAAGYARWKAEAEKTRRLYNELLYQIETKNPGETRHETALVYIRMAEKYLRNQNASEVKPVDKP